MRMVMFRFLAALMLGGLVASSAAAAWCQDDLPAPRNDQSGDARKQLIDRMVDEMASLIPGQAGDQADRRQRLSAVAAAFLAADESATRFRLEQLRESQPDLPPDFLLLAGMSFIAGNPMQGKILLERAGSLHREHPGIPLFFGRLALSQGRLYDAQALVEKANRINEASDLSPDARNFYACGALNALAAVEIRRNALGRAEGFVREWEQLAPQDDQMLMASGEIAFLQQREAESIAYLDRRSSDSRDQIPTPVLLARWYRNRNDTENYAKWIKQAYKQFPDHALAQLEYAAWLLRNEDFDAVEKVIEAYQVQHGDSSESRRFLGRIAFARQQFDKAESYFADVFREQPSNFESAYLYVLSLLESQDRQKYPQAIEIAQRNQQLFPGNQLALACLGWAFWRTNQADLAKQWLSRASEMGELLPDTAYFLARTMYDEGQGARAKVILEPFLDSPDVFLYRSSARKMVEQIKQD